MTMEVAHRLFYALIGGQQYCSIPSAGVLFPTGRRVPTPPRGHDSYNQG